MFNLVSKRERVFTVEDGWHYLIDVTVGDVLPGLALTEADALYVGTWEVLPQCLNTLVEKERYQDIFNDTLLYDNGLNGLNRID